MHFIQNYLFIALDRFREIKQNEVTEELDAWLHFISSEEPDILYEIINKYPFFREIYDEITEFRNDIAGVLSMFSEALKIMDRNTVQYMIDEMREELEKKNALIQSVNRRVKSTSGTKRYLDFMSEYK